MFLKKGTVCAVNVVGLFARLFEGGVSRLVPILARIGEFRFQCFTSHTPPEQSLGGVFEKRMWSQQPAQKPKADSKNRKLMQIPHSASGIGPDKASQPIVKQAVTTIPKPIYQAVFFGSASTHSGIWLRVTNRPMIIDGL